MRMMMRWQQQQQPDWSTNTTINLVWYNSGRNSKGNGGAGVMGRLVGQATCMVPAWRPGRTDHKSVIAEMRTNKKWLNKWFTMKEWTKEQQTNKRQKMTKPAWWQKWQLQRWWRLWPIRWQRQTVTLFCPLEQSQLLTPWREWHQTTRIHHHP